MLRLGTYQLLRTRVSPHAAVSTSVDLVRAENGMGPAGFVNAVLRKVSQKTEEMWVDELAPSPAEDLVGDLAFQYAHPRWIAEVFRDALVVRPASCRPCSPPTTSGRRCISSRGPA